MLINCPACGMIVSDKAYKCPKCGKSFVQEPRVDMEYEGIIKILDKVAEIHSKFPYFRLKLSVFQDNFTMEPLIEVFTENDGSHPFDTETTKTAGQCAADADSDWDDIFLVQIDGEELKKTNRVTDFEALEYYADFSSSEESGDTCRWVLVNSASKAAKVVYDLLVGVFKKKLSPACFVITGVESDDDNAKYNADGDFLEGKGYGQGEFAYYRDPEIFQEKSEGNGILHTMIFWLLVGIGVLVLIVWI